jgi:hypothetical protein
MRALARQIFRISDFEFRIFLGGCRRSLGLLGSRPGFCAPRLPSGFRGFLQTIDVSEAAAALLDFIVLFTHKVSPPL